MLEKGPKAYIYIYIDSGGSLNACSPTLIYELNSSLRRMISIRLGLKFGSLELSCCSGLPVSNLTNHIETLWFCNLAVSYNYVDRFNLHSLLIFYCVDVYTMMHLTLTYKSVTALVLA